MDLLQVFVHCPEYTGQGIMKKLMYQNSGTYETAGKLRLLLFIILGTTVVILGWEIISNKISFDIEKTGSSDESKTAGGGRWDNTDFDEYIGGFPSITHGCCFRNALAWEDAALG